MLRKLCMQAALPLAGLAVVVAGPAMVGPDRGAAMERPSPMPPAGTTTHGDSRAVAIPISTARLLRSAAPSSATQTGAAVRILRIRAVSGMPARITVNGRPARSRYVVRVGQRVRLQAQFVASDFVDCWTFRRWEERSPGRPPRRIHSPFGPYLDYTAHVLPRQAPTLVAVYAHTPGRQCPL